MAPGHTSGRGRTSVGLPELIACDMARMGCWQWHAIDVGDGRVASIYELLDRAVAAINRGDRVAASALADQVLAVDGGNGEAEDLLTAPGDAGEIRRLTILFADLVDSTVLSTWSPRAIGCWWGATRSGDSGRGPLRGPCRFDQG